MGYAVAAEAARRGARVVLVSGPTHLDPPPGVELVRVRRAAEMHARCSACAGDADVVVMAAAVADYTPAQRRAGGKIEKSDGPLDADARADAGHPRRARRGARRQRRGRCWSALRRKAAIRWRAAATSCARKSVDLIVANDISRPDAGFDGDSNAVTIVSADGAEPTKSSASDRRPRSPRAILDRAERSLEPRQT